MSELLPCPFCGSDPVMKHIGNDHTKSRAVEVKCSNAYCRVARTDKALRHDHAWLTKVATENWNRRPATTQAPSAPVAPDQNAAFEAWAKKEGLIQESHGIRSTSSVCAVAQLAFDAGAALSVQAVLGGPVCETGMPMRKMHRWHRRVAPGTLLYEAAPTPPTTGEA